MGSYPGNAYENKIKLYYMKMWLSRMWQNAT